MININLFCEKYQWVLVWGIGILASLVTVWQSTRAVPLIDYSYQMENAYRLYRGDVLYHDFSLVVVPGTYVVMAILMKLFGTTNLVQQVYVAGIALLTIPLTFFILQAIKSNASINIIALLPLVFSGQAIYAFPSYDINATFIMLSALAYFCYFIAQKVKIGQSVILGVLITLPVFFKQNTGIIFWGTMLITFMFIIWKNDKQVSWKHFFMAFASSIFVLLVTLGALIHFDIFQDFWFQTFIYPGMKRSIVENSKAVFTSYLSKQAFFEYGFWGAITLIYYRWQFLRKHAILFFTLVISCFVGFFFLNMFFKGNGSAYLTVFSLWNLVGLVSVMFLANHAWMEKSRNNVGCAVLFVLLLTANASFLSQGISGSTYGIWPLFIIALTILSTANQSLFNILRVPSMMVGIALALCFILAIYCWQQERLKFVDLQGERQQADTAKLKGLSTGGNWLPSFEDLVVFVENEVPKDESIVAFPGEDPFYYVTERKNHFPYAQFNPITFPHDEQWIWDELQIRRIKWVVIKKELQCPKGFLNLDWLATNIQSHYKLYKILNKYDIYILEDD